MTSQDSASDQHGSPSARGIRADAFLTPAIARGWSSWTGVPCSFLTPLINGVASDRRVAYVPATSEGEAIAIAAGAWFAGRRAVAMMQNSGLGNAVNPLTSLCAPFRIPILTLVTWRGQPGLKDEPQHELMGRITHRLLDTMEVAHAPFPTDASRIDAALDAAEASMAARSLPFCLVMEKGSVLDSDLDEPARIARPSGERHDFTAGGPRPARAALLERALAALPDAAAVIATTGKSGRELFTLADRDQHLYCVGSMGGASAIGLGVALHADRPVVVLDGDGAALMKLGNLATIGAAAPARYVHVLLDNGVHDSTGGQATVAPGVDFAAVALACGYRAAFTTDDENGFERALRRALAMTGPVLLHARMAPGSMARLGRPTVPPDAVARRFRAFVAPQAVAA